MKEQLKTRLATLVSQEKLENVVRQLRGQSDARINAFIKVLGIAKLRMFRMDIAEAVCSASQGENRNGNPEIVVSIKCSVNSLATRLSGGEPNIDGILDDMSSGETIRRFSKAYCDALAKAYNTDSDTFVTALNAFGGTYKATAKLQEKGEEWSNNDDESGVFENDWYQDESVKIKLSTKAAEWIFNQKKSVTVEQIDSDPFDSVSTPESDEPMPF